MTSLMKSYKSEMDQVLAADKLLAQEIQYDLERFEKEEELAKARAEEAAAGLHHNGSASENIASSANKRRQSRRSSLSKSAGKKSRRVSGVTFHPSAKDTMARNSTGVLKTPIPVSAKKSRSSRRSSLQDELEGLVTADNNYNKRASVTPAPKRLSMSNRKPLHSAQKIKLTLDDSPPLVASVSRSGRKWSVESSTEPSLLSLPKPPSLV
jgi:hypothetical protein